MWRAVKLTIQTIRAIDKSQAIFQNFIYSIKCLYSYYFNSTTEYKSHNGMLLIVAMNRKQIRSHTHTHTAQSQGPVCCHAVNGPIVIKFVAHNEIDQQEQNAIIVSYHPVCAPICPNQSTNQIEKPSNVKAKWSIVPLVVSLCHQHYTVHQTTSIAAGNSSSNDKRPK